MGINQSGPGISYKEGLFNLSDIFTKETVEYIKSEVIHQITLKEVISPIDNVDLSIILQNLINQQKIGDLKLGKEFETKYFENIQQDLDNNYENGKIYPIAFAILRGIISKYLNNKKISYDRDLEYTKNKYMSLNETKPRLSIFLENMISCVFDMCVEKIDAIDIEQLENSLNNLSDILSKEKPKSLSLKSSPILNSINRLTSQKTKNSKLQTQKISTKIIDILFSITYIQNNVFGILEILKFMLFLKKSINIESKFDEEKTFGICRLPRNQFSFEIKQSDGKAVDFSINRYVIALTKNSGIIKFISPNPIYIKIPVEYDSKILETSSELLIFSITSNSLISLPIDSVDNKEVKTQKLDSYIDISQKIISLGFSNNKIIIVQSNVEEMTITAFNKTFQDKITLKHTNLSPKFIYFESGNVNFLIDNFIRTYKIDYDTCKLIQTGKNKFFGNYFFSDYPSTFYKNNIISVTQKNNKLFFIKYPIYTNLSFKGDIEDISYMILPQGQSNYLNLITTISNSLNLAINQQVISLINNPKFLPKFYFLFFTSEDNNIIYSSISLISYVLDLDDSITNEMKSSIISIGFKLIGLNLFVYIQKFYGNIELFDESDKKLFNCIVDIMIRCSESECYNASSSIIESILVVLHLSFQYLFYPNYCKIYSLIQKLYDNGNKVSKNNFLCSLSMFKKSPILFYVINDITYIDIIKSFRKDDIQSLFIDSLNNLNNFLNFLNENYILENEKSLIPFFDVLLQFIESISDDDRILNPLIQTLMFRLSTIDSFPCISSTIAEKAIPIMQKLITKYSSEELIESDIKFIDHKKEPISFQQNVAIVESPHNYEDNSDVVQYVTFENSSVIRLDFDPRCRTETDSDYLAIYDLDNDGKQLFKLSGSRDWPTSVELQTSSLKFCFRSDGSVNYWGYRVICTSTEVSNTNIFNPSPTLFFINFYCYIIGRLTLNGIKSLPMSTEENQCKLLIESDILQDVNQISKENKTFKTKSDKYNLKRGISRGMSFDTDQSECRYSEEFKKGFIQDLISLDMNNVDNPAVLLLKAMHSNIRSNINTKNKDIFIAERYAFAALLKQLGLLNQTISFSMNLNSQPQKINIPNNLRITWKAIFRIRKILISSNQKTKSLEGNPKSLMENFAAFINEIKHKSLILLYNEPLLKKISNNNQNPDNELIEKAINDCVSFITSNLPMENIDRMIEQRNKRISIRIKSLISLYNFIRIKTPLLSSQLSFIDPLSSCLQLISDVSDITNSKVELNEQLKEIFSKVQTYLIHQICKNDIYETQRICYLKFISYSFNSMISKEDLNSYFKILSRFWLNVPNNSFESFISYSCSWKLIAYWTLNYRTKEIVEFLTDYGLNSTNEKSKYYSILLLTLLLQAGEDIKYGLFDLMNQKSNRTVNAIILLIAHHLTYHSNDDFNVMINEKKYDFNSFIHFLLKSAGQSLCGKCSPLVHDNNKIETLQLIGGEIISSFRLMLKSTSKSRDRIIEIFHEILMEFDLENSLHKIIAIFSILGKEVISYHSGGYTIHNYKSSYSINTIRTYDNLDNLIISSNNFGKETPINLSITNLYSPSCRYQCYHFNFILNKKEIEHIIKLNSKVVSIINSENFSKVEDYLLASCFFGFITVIFQIEENISLLMENSNIFDFLSLVSSKIFSKQFCSIGNLTNKISRFSNQINNFSNSNVQSISFPYSLVSNKVTPTKFIPLTQGKIDIKNNIITSSEDFVSIFIGDKFISSSQLFYYEVQIDSPEINFILGYVNKTSKTESLRIYGFNFATNTMMSPFLEENISTNIILKANDVIGCGFNAQYIFFFINGIKQPFMIPCPNVDDFSPIILTNQCLINFTYNFGNKNYVTSFSNSTDFNIKTFCLQNLQIPYRTKQAESPTSNLISSECYEKVISSQLTNYEVSKTHKLSKEKFYSITKETNIQHKNISSPFKFFELKYNLFYVGQIVYIAKRDLSKKDTMYQGYSFPGIDALKQLNNFAIITNVQPKNMYSILTVSKINDRNVKFEIDSRYVEAVNCKFTTILKNISRRQIFSQFQNDDYFLNQQKKKLIYYTRSYCIKLSRYLFLIFLDYSRITNNIKQFLQNENFAKMISSSINEVCKFKHNVVSTDKWSCINNSDFIIGNFKYPGDSFSYSRFIHVFLTNCIYLFGEKIIIPFFKYLIKKISTTPIKSGEQLMSFIKKEFILESWNPQPSFQFLSNISFSDGCYGFIPILHHKHNITNKVYVNNQPISDPISDCYLMTSNNCKIFIQSPADNNKTGLHLGILPIYKYIQENLKSTALGSIHALLTILSILFSKRLTKEFEPETNEFLKQFVIPSITEIINTNNLFVNVFSFEILTPILTLLNWNNKDLSNNVRKGFDKFSKIYNKSIAEWAPISLYTQKALIITTFTKLILIDSESNGLKDDANQNDIKKLFDLYLSSIAGPDAPIFEQMKSFIAYCSALGFDKPISIRFPTFLFAESWAESIPIQKTYKITKKETKIVFNDMQQCVIELKTPIDETRTIVNISTNLNDSNIKPNVKTSVTSPALIIVNNVDESDQIDLKFIVTGYPKTYEAKCNAFIDNFSQFKKDMEFMKNNWKVDYDETISKAIKNIPNITKMLPFTTSDPFFEIETILNNIPPRIVRSRIQIIYNFSKLVPNIIKVVKIGDTSTILSSLFQSTTSAISTEFKIKTVDNIVLRNMQSGNQGKINLRFNRFKKSLLETKPNDPAGQSILSQFIQQVPESELIRMKRKDVPWHVDLIGEGSTDAGGPGRDLFTEVCMEIMHPMNGLFIQSPNKRVNQQNVNQELLIPNPSPLNEDKKKMYYYAGVLMACCYTSRLPEPFQFAKLVWKSLTKKKISIDDIYEIDLEFKQLMNELEECNPNITQQQFSSLYPYTFQVQNSLGEMVELVPDGGSINVTINNRIDFIRRCKKYRLNEFTEQLYYLKLGFELFFDDNASSILSPWEIEMLICGHFQCPVSELKKNCRYPDNVYSERLWRVLETFNPKERMLFVKFGCGRMGLPPPGMEWSDKLVIKFVSDSKPDCNKSLPTAATCNSTISIPQYETDEWMAKKLRTAITFGADIDRDHEANISAIEQFT